MSAVKKRRETGARTAGRPRSFETEQVLDAALELFWQRGYRATTTRELEASLGLRQSSLYNAFGSKRDLLAATLDRYEALTAKELLEPLAGAPDGIGAIERFLARLGRWVTRGGRRGCLLINMMAEDGGATEELKLRTRAYRRRVRVALREALSRAATRGETSAADLESRADLLLGLVLGYNVAARGGASRGELGRMLAAARGQLASWKTPAAAETLR